MQEGGVLEARGEPVLGGALTSAVVAESGTVAPTDAEPAATAPARAVERFRSVDALRGLDILVMIFVNDLAGVAGVPAWMKHVARDADGMTFVDVVFPAFLFIVGMSIPLALGPRFERGEPRARIWAHVLARTVALLVVGVYIVNGDTMSERGALSPAAWNLLLYVAVILVWSAPPREAGPRRTAALGARAAGVLLLVALAVVYRGPGDPGFVELRTQWWGILGLIGWAYLVACLAYATLRKSVAGMVGTVALLYCVFLASAAGAFSGLTWITWWVDIGSMWGSHAAIALSGAVLGTMLAAGSAAATPSRRIRSAVLLGLGLAAAGSLLHAARGIHPAFFVNKILATPPWGLWCSAITAWVWAGVSWLMEVRRWTGWATGLESAGRNALLAYLLAPGLIFLFELLTAAFGRPDYYGDLGRTFAVGLVRSAAFALAVTWLAGWLGRAGVRLRL